jgi:hypothetical protein
VVHNIQTRLRENVHIRIALVLHGPHGFPADDFSIPEWEGNRSPTPRIRRLLRALVDVTSLKRVELPAPRRVEFELYVMVPLSYRLATNAKEVKACEASFRESGDINMPLIVPKCKKSRKATYWRLHETPQSVGCGGFWPEFRGTSARRSLEDFNFML